MIAREGLGVFADLLDRLDGLAPDDTINGALRDYDAAAEDDPATAYLTDGALPLDPSRAAILAVIDDALPFAHQRLRVGPHPRVASVWFQDAPPDPASPVGGDLPFGRELRGGQIARLVARLEQGSLADEEALYRAAGVLDPRRRSPQRLAHAAGHGAAIGGLAAGFGRTEAGLARNLPIIAVCLPPHVVRDTLGTAAPFYIMLAILHVVHRARRLCRVLERRRGLPAGAVRLPVVVNLSFGLTAGPKDGSSDLERLMDAVSAATAPDLGPVRFVVANGNHRLSRVRARIVANPDEPLAWLVRPDDGTPSYLELWGPARDGEAPPASPMQIECRLPGAAKAVTTTFATHGSYQTLTAGGREVARAYLQHRTFEGHGREVVTLVALPTRPERLGDPYGVPGCWRVRPLSPLGGDVDAFVQRDDSLPGFGAQRGRQSRLLDPAAPALDAVGRPQLRDPPGRTHGVLRTGTINAFGTGREVIRVGGGFAEGGAVLPSSGLAMDGDADEAEGDIVAPAAFSAGHPDLRVMGTRSGSWSQAVGTSMAAALVSRELALAFAAGEVTGLTHGSLCEVLRRRPSLRHGSQVADHGRPEPEPGVAPS